MRNNGHLIGIFGTILVGAFLLFLYTAKDSSVQAQGTPFSVYTTKYNCVYVAVTQVSRVAIAVIPRVPEPYKMGQCE